MRNAARSVYQLLLMEGMPPAAALRLEHADVEMIPRARACGLTDAGLSWAGLEGETHKFRGAGRCQLCNRP
jgi:hypothetical protein